MDTNVTKKSRTTLVIASIIPVIMMLFFILMLTHTLPSMPGIIEILLGLEFIVLYKHNGQKASIAFGLVVMVIGILRFFI